MALIRTPKPVKLFVGMLASQAEWLDRAADELVRVWGEPDLVSETFAFDWTDYYEKTMGKGLLRRFVTFRRLIAPDLLPVIKRGTSALEEMLAGQVVASVPRPVNLDPGYLTEAKVVLATAKDYSHRLYLGGGIYGEVTLHYTDGRWQPWPWTYPDYRSEAYLAFFAQVRRLFLVQQKSLREEYFQEGGAMGIEVIQSERAPAAIGPYSQAIRAGGFVFVSGQIPLDPATGELVEGDVRSQARRSLLNIQEILAAAGTSMNQVVKATVYLRDLNEYTSVNEVYAEFFGNSKPARAAVQVARLPKDAAVEIEVVALA